MMISPSSNDSSAVFALLTAISSPAAAKASLKEISDASEAFTKSIETSRAEDKKAREEFEINKTIFEEFYSSKKEEIDNFNATYDKRTKQLEAQANDLSKRQVTMDSLEADQKVRLSDISSKENQLNLRESNVSSREIEAEKLYQLSQNLQQELSTKLKGLKDLIN